MLHLAKRYVVTSEVWLLAENTGMDQRTTAAPLHHTYAWKNVRYPLPVRLANTELAFSHGHVYG